MTVNTFEVIVWGEPSFDTVVSLVTDEKLGSRNEAVIVEGVGGSGANSASSLSQMGIETALIGFLGSDIIGQRIEAELATHVLPTVMGRTPRNRRTVSIARSDGTRTMYGSTGDQYKSTEDLTARISHLRCDWFHVSLTSILRAEHSLIPATAAHFRSYGALISIDAGNDVEIASRSSEIPEIFANIRPDVTFANEVEMEALASSLVDLQVLPMLVVKKGPKPCEIWRYGELDFSIPAEHVTNAVDTTGAGDAFAAGMLAGLARGLDARLCAELGHRLGSACISGIGASIQSTEVFDFARQFLFEHCSD